MNRIIASTAFAALVLSSASAFAAATTTPASNTSTAPAHASSTPIDYAARCTSLATQWKTAEEGNATNAHLGKAKADAAKGEKLCASTKSSDHKKGAMDYEAALKLLGVTPA